MNYQAVLFDFGGVFTASPFHAVENFAQRENIEPQLFADTIFGQYGIDGDHPWHQIERGEISLDDAREQIIQLGEQRGFTADIFTVFASMADNGGSPRTALAELAIEIRNAGAITACVTNNIKEFGEGWKGMLPVDKMFHHIIDSSHVGVRKPEAEIFSIALKTVGVEASRALFLDDFGANVDAAKALGIDSILVTPDEEKTIIDLRRALGL